MAVDERIPSFAFAYFVQLPMSKQFIQNTLSCLPGYAGTRDEFLYIDCLRLGCRQELQNCIFVIL